MRAVLLVSSVVMTYFIDPATMGEVTTAAILTVTANRFSQFGIPQFLLTQRQDRPDINWHGTVALVLTGIVAIGGAALVAPRLAGWLQAPNLGLYVPGLALSVLLGRVSMIPERLIQRQLRYRFVSLTRGASEASYAATALLGAMAGLGGFAIVLGNLVRNAVLLAIYARALPRKEWLAPAPYSPSTVRSMVAFGLPLTAAVILAVATRAWDTLHMSAMFGAATAGAYALAYNLADMPSEVGENLNDVLTPAFVHMDEAGARRALVRWTALMCMLAYPMSVGLGAVAPTLVRTVLRPEWAAVAPMLTLLSVISLSRPVAMTIGSFLASAHRTGTVMRLVLIQTTVLFPCMYLLGRMGGPLYACAGAGLAYFLHAGASVLVMVRTEGSSWRAFAEAIVRPLLACVPMAAAVLAVRHGLAAAGFWHRGLNLGLEVGVGVAAYAAGAWLLARPAALDLIALLRQSRHGTPMNLPEQDATPTTNV